MHTLVYLSFIWLISSCPSGIFFLGIFLNVTTPRVKPFLTLTHPLFLYAPTIKALTNGWEIVTL